MQAKARYDKQLNQGSATESDTGMQATVSSHHGQVAHILGI